MKIVLDRAQIDVAIRLGQETLARYIEVYGHYNNDFNSHTKGRFGEIAVDAFFTGRRRQVTSHYLDPLYDRLCDLEVEPAPFRRLEVKTWSESDWPALGRCITPRQAKSLDKKADAVIWCTVPLPYLRSSQDLAAIENIEVTFRGYSLPADVVQAPVRETGRRGRRQVLNHQIDDALIRPAEEILV